MLALLAKEPSHGYQIRARLQRGWPADEAMNAAQIYVTLSGLENAGLLRCGQESAADRLISMRDGAFIGETRLTGGTSTGALGLLAGLDG